MMREEVPSHGKVIIKNQDLSTLTRSEIPYFRRGLGIVFQDFRLIPKMTVFDNVAFAMRVTGSKENKIQKRVPFVLDIVGLTDKMNCYPTELSGGEQQRVALARALANNADLIIADEPTGNVDPHMSLEIVDLLMRLNQEGTTVIMVTHEHNLVRMYDKRVILLENGTVAADGRMKIPLTVSARLQNQAVSTDRRTASRRSISTTRKKFRRRNLPQRSPKSSRKRRKR